MVEENLRIANRAGEKLKALLRRPDGKGPFPAVVFVHGLGMTMHERNNSFDEIAKLLNREKFLTLQLQFPIFETNGFVRELPLSLRAHHLEDVLVWMIKQYYIDAERIGILAQSYGVPTVISAKVSGVRSLVFVSGAYNPLENVTRVYASRGVAINYEGDTTLPRSSGEFTTVGKEFWQSLSDYDEQNSARQLTVPSLLLLHGDKDVYVKEKYLQQFYAALSVPNKRLKIFKGGDHGIIDVSRPMREEFLREVVAWFTKTL